MSSIDLRSTRSSSSFSSSDQLTQSQSSVKQATPKKKRCRMNKVQLAQLECAFAMDPSPIGPRRREISLQIGAHERQVQVWFQNRRAKAKNDEKLKRQHLLRVPSPDKGPPELRQAVQTELAMLIQEDDLSIFTIPCSTLSIGAWCRVNPGNCNELLAWICEKKRCLVWFIHSKDYSFKMQVPLDDLKEIVFKNADPGKGFLTIDILRPPLFFLRRNPRRETGTPLPVWRRCEDWTENKVASRNLRHVLGGPALPLVNVVTYIKNQTENQKAVLLHPVNYRPNNICTPPTPALTSTTPTFSTPSVGDTFYLAPTDKQFVTRSWDSQPCPENQPTPLYDVKSPLHQYQYYAGSAQSALGLHGIDTYTDPRTSDERTRFLGMDGMGDESLNRPTLPPSPLKQAYHGAIHQHPHHTMPVYHQTPFVLPGLSELFADPRHS